MLFENVTQKHVNQAIAKAKKDGWKPKSNSQKWDLVTDDGTRYPPKVILALANAIAGEHGFTVGDFNASYRIVLENLGYNILPKIKNSIEEDIRGGFKFEVQLAG